MTKGYCYFSSRDLALIASFSALSSVSILLTNVINLVGILGIPGLNSIYVRAISCFFIWVGVGCVSKFGGATLILLIDAIFSNFLPGGPGALKLTFIATALLTGLATDVVVSKTKRGVWSHSNACIFGSLDGLSVIPIQIALRIPLFSPRLIAWAGWAVIGVGIMARVLGANMAIPVLRRLRHTGIIRLPLHVTANVVRLTERKA